MLGRLPARLLALPSHWPPQRQLELLEDPLTAPAEQGITTTAALPTPQVQREALEDWYGRLHNDGSYPQHNGKGPVEEPLACLRMLARHFDLPFRRDVLNRILNDQLKRSGQGALPLQAVAAICDLLGLRTTGLQPNSADPVSYTHLTLPTICSV